MRRFITPVLLDSSVSKTDFTVIPVSRSKSFRIGSEKTWSSLTYTTTVRELAGRHEVRIGISAKLTKMRNSISILVSFALIPILTSCRPASSRTVVVYVSEDQVFSEPILKDFERETGITVKSVFDTEESKSTGVMNRLIAEKDNPQADVYWANEPVRADALKQRGVCTPYVSPAAEGIPD